MSLIVNGVTVDKVIVNGTEIQELSVNGTVVSHKIQETNIQVIVIDSDGNGGQLVGGA